MVRKKKFFSVEVVTSLYVWAFTLNLCFSLDLVLKYKKHGPREQGVVCGDKGVCVLRGCRLGVRTGG